MPDEAREDAVVIPIGSNEQHGPTGLLGTDWLCPEVIANEAQKTYKERALKIGAHHVANLVTALCTPAANGITGQLLGVRGREVFLFGQPRPVARIEAGATLAQDLSTKLADKFTDLTTDLEAFNTGHKTVRGA